MATVSELIAALGGTLLQGNPQQTVAGVNAPHAAQLADLVFAESEAAAAEAVASRAAAVVLKKGIGALLVSNPSIAIIEADQPRLWFARAAKTLLPKPPSEGIHFSAVIDVSAVFGSDVTIGPHAAIGANVIIGDQTRIDAGVVIGEEVRIGANCRIHPRVVIYPGTTIGDRVVAFAGAVLGADGFGYVRDANTGAYTQFPQRGGLVIEDDVEIGANTTIDRGALGATRIRRGVKLDNLIHIAHNCDIGEDVVMAAQVGISGSSTVGKGAVLAGQVGMGDHAHVGDGVILGGQSGVFSGKTVTNKGVPPGTVFFGTPVKPARQALREQAVLARLAKKKSSE